MELVTAVALGTLFGVGIFMLLRRNIVRSAIGVVLTGNAVNLFLVMCGAYRGEVPAYTTVAGPPSDPLPQALALTAIVIGLGGFAFVLGMLYVLAIRYRTGDMSRIDRLRY